MAKFEYIEWLSNFLNRSVFYFDWDSGNDSKSLIKHNVDTSEAEEVFYDIDIVPFGIQTQPQADEIRLAVVGKTYSEKILFINFTMRESKIRIISARSANKEEKDIYENKKIR